MAGVVARQSLTATVVTYLGVAIGFLTTFFVQTRYLTEEQVGLVRLLIEVSTLISTFALLGLSTSLNRYFPYYHTEHPEHSGRVVQTHRGFFGLVMGVALLGIALVLPLYILPRSWIEGQLLERSALFLDYYWSVIPLFISIALWTVAELYTVQMLRLVVPKGIKELLLRVLLLLSYLFYAMGWMSFTAVVHGVVLSYALCMALSFCYLSRLAPLTFSRDALSPPPAVRRGFVRFSAIALLATAGTTLAGRMDIFMLAFIDYGGLVSVGIFTIAFFLVSMMEIPTRAIISIATARFSLLMGQGNWQAVSTLYRQVGFYQCLTAAILYCLIGCNLNELFLIMPNGEAYRGAEDVFLVLGLSKLIEVLCTAAHPILNNSRHYYWSLIYTLMLCLLAFGFNLVLIPKWGTLGAATATGLTTTLGYALLLIVLGRYYALHPFSWRLLVIPLLMWLLFVVGLNVPTLGNPYIDICLRSGVMLTLASLALLLLPIVPEAKELLINKLGIKR